MLEDISSRQYLVRAVYDWCVDQRNTPYILVGFNEGSASKLPAALAQDGKIVFNLSPDAVRNLLIDDFGVHFTARFSGRTTEVQVAHTDIISVYSRERHTGITFPPLPDIAAAGAVAATPPAQKSATTPKAKTPAKTAPAPAASPRRRQKNTSGKNITVNDIKII